jgi:hypothetical protein
LDIKGENLLVLQMMKRKLDICGLNGRDRKDEESISG